MAVQNDLNHPNRDAVLAAAMCRALYAMALTNGCPVSMGGVNAVLNFDGELAQLHRALALLGVDAGRQLSARPPAR